MEIKTSFLDERKDDVVKALKAYNDALKTNDASKIRSTEHSLKEAEAEYAKQKAVEVYRECANQPNPIIYAIKTFFNSKRYFSSIKINFFTVSFDYY